MIGAGRELPLNRPITGAEVESPSYTLTKSADDSVAKLLNKSSITAFEVRFHRQSILLLYVELELPVE